MEVTRKELADFFNVDTRTLTNWQQAGMPVYVVGKGSQSSKHLSEDVLAWYVQDTLIKEKSGQQRHERGQLHDAQTDLTAARAEREKLRTAELRKSLVDRQEIENDYADNVRVAAGRLIGGKGAMVNAIQGKVTPAEIQTAYLDVVYEVIDELFHAFTAVPPELADYVDELKELG